jgi:hypothetical protein
VVGDVGDAPPCGRRLGDPGVGPDLGDEGGKGTQPDGHTSAVESNARNGCFRDITDRAHPAQPAKLRGYEGH